MVPSVSVRQSLHSVHNNEVNCNDTQLCQRFSKTCHNFVLISRRCLYFTNWSVNLTLCVLSIVMYIYSYHTTAHDISSDVLVRRSCTLTVNLSRTTILNFINILQTYSLSIICMNMFTSDGPLLLLTIYMPTKNDGDDSVGKGNWSTLITAVI